MNKDDEEEKHCHPLQLDVIERCIVMYSNPNEIVLTPFMGVGSEVYQAIKLGRKAIGIELKPSYYRQSKKNIATIEVATVEDQMSLFGNGNNYDDLGMDTDMGVDESSQQLEIVNAPVERR